MRTLFDDAEFCRDSFGEDVSSLSKDEVVAKMVGAAKRTRRVRRVRIASVAVLCAVMIGSVMLRTPPPRAASEQKINRPSDWIVQSAPFEGIVRSESLVEGFLVENSDSPVSIVETTNLRMFQELTDDQLLDLLKERPVALVKISGTTRLEFLDEPITDSGGQ